MDRHDAYAARLDRWRDRLEGMTFTEAQTEGFACVACGWNHLEHPDPERRCVPVGFGPRGQVFVCVECDTE